MAEEVKPFKCPICNGTGNVPGGFYESVGDGEWASTRLADECRKCEGKGIIWSESESAPCLKKKLLIDFETKLRDKQVDIDPDIQEVINRRFEDMI